MAKMTNPGKAAKMTAKKATPKKAAAAGINKGTTQPRYPSTAGSMVPSKGSGTKGAGMSARQARQQKQMQGRMGGKMMKPPMGGNL